MSDLDGILFMQNELKVAYCNYSFVGEQRHSRTIGKYNAPSMWVFQSCSLHGVGTLRHPKFLRCGGDQQDGKNCGNEAASCINLIQTSFGKFCHRWERRLVADDQRLEGHAWVRVFPVLSLVEVPWWLLCLGTRWDEQI